jgi:hypothetical protein
MSTRVVAESDHEPSGTAHRVRVIIFRVVSTPAGLFFVVAGVLMASGVRSQCRCRSTLSSHSPPRDRRAFATAARGQQSGATSNSPTMAKFDGTHEKRGVSCRPVRSQDVPAGSSTVTAMFAAVQWVQPLSVQQRLRRRHPSLPTSLASRRSVGGRDFHRSRKVRVT